MINDQFNFLDQLDDVETSSIESDDRWGVRHFSSTDDFDELRYPFVLTWSPDHVISIFVTDNIIGQTLTYQWTVSHLQSPLLEWSVLCIIMSVCLRSDI